MREETLLWMVEEIRAMDESECTEGRLLRTYRKLSLIVENQRIHVRRFLVFWTVACVVSPITFLVFASFASFKAVLAAVLLEVPFAALLYLMLRITAVHDFRETMRWLRDSLEHNPYFRDDFNTLRRIDLEVGEKILPLLRMIEK